MPAIGGFMKLSSEWSAATARVSPAPPTTSIAMARNWNSSEIGHRRSRTPRDRARSGSGRLGGMISSRMPHARPAGFPSFIGGAPRAREAKRDQDQVIDIPRFRARKQVITGWREGNGNARHQRALEQTRPAYRFTICSVQGAEPARWPREARTRGRPQDAEVPRESQAAIFSKRIPSPSHLLLPREGTRVLSLFGALDQAGVAVGEEPVAGGDRMGVGGLDPVEPGERGYQHQQSRARQVEIGQQHVDSAEAVAGHDEQARLAGKGPDLAVLKGSALDEAQARCPDRDEAAGSALGCRNALSGLGGENAAFGVHRMVARIGNLDRQERAGPDMQGECRPPDASARERFEERGREMETGSRGRDRAFFVREDRLVIIAVTRVAATRPLDIGRQRHRAVAGEHLVKCRSGKIEPQTHVALGVLFCDLGSKAFGESEAIAGSQAPRALRKSSP